MKIRFFGRIIIIPVWLKYAFIALIVAGLSAAGFFISKEANSGVVNVVEGNTGQELLPTESSGAEEMTLRPSPTPEIKIITVYIVGAVAVSDVYDLPEGSILNDLVLMAGGLAEGADREAVNLAAELKNGMMVRIPYLTDSDKRWMVDGGNTGSSKITENGGLVNINTADVSELCTLPGVGESTALKIISYRTENGPFEKITDIMNVGGIKTAKYNEIKNYITVG